MRFTLTDGNTVMVKPVTAAILAHHETLSVYHLQEADWAKVLFLIALITVHCVIGGTSAGG